MLQQLKKFLTYLLAVSNQMFVKLLERVICILPPMKWDTVSNIRRIQQVDVVLQNAIYSKSRTACAGWLEAL